MTQPIIIQLVSNVRFDILIYVKKANHFKISKKKYMPINLKHKKQHKVRAKEKVYNESVEEVTTY